jgi:hypothetical protein
MATAISCAQVGELRWSSTTRSESRSFAKRNMVRTKLLPVAA